jgi:hypothetical protein
MLRTSTVLDTWHVCALLRRLATLASPQTQNSSRCFSKRSEKNLGIVDFQSAFALRASADKRGL